MFNGSLWEILSLMSPVALWGVGRGSDCIGQCLLPWELSVTLVLITIPTPPPSAAKAVDGYVKPQIKQVVPE